MGHFRKQNMSFENFSHPNMSISQDDHDLEFEFCRVIEPGASPNSPADHLFSNGRLVPHDFPCSPSTTFNSLSRSVSWRSSSLDSNHGFESSSSSSSWSNSCSSSQRSNSSTSSGSTSISDKTPERRELIRARGPKRTASKCTQVPYKAQKHVSTPDYSSRKWQFIAEAPVLNGKVSHRSGKVSQRKIAEAVDHQTVMKAKEQGKSNGRWRRFFCLFVSACHEFHAIEPSTREY